MKELVIHDLPEWKSSHGRDETYIKNLYGDIITNGKFSFPTEIYYSYRDPVNKKEKFFWIRIKNESCYYDSNGNLINSIGYTIYHDDLKVVKDIKNKLYYAAMRNWLRYNLLEIIIFKILPITLSIIALFT